MWRVIWEPALLFLSPFFAYAIWLVLRRHGPFSSHHWTQGTVSMLSLVGLAGAVIFMLVFGLSAKRHMGAYVPAHIENGQIVPGRME
ncbi:DUF6111 family protein [Methylovirgula sp. HY1]|uniref:DUF6111 family protein n=1 Tax=Methylovirgula sp. HY1 TaxID=2822761 RepID=UPI001C5AF51C|nr:DUF6111 family protein [Methylovirgula sp. HY1]QXX76350.1 hypothetical protein MHY1_03190 [Methylovirgula sp. HY1]